MAKRNAGIAPVTMEYQMRYRNRSGEWTTLLSQYVSDGNRLAEWAARMDRDNKGSRAIEYRIVVGSGLLSASSLIPKQRGPYLR